MSHLQKSIIFFVILSITIVYSQQQYLNFEPYLNSKCTGSIEGIGYSVLMNECLSFDQNTTYIFKSKSSKQITWSEYGIFNGDSTCNSNSLNTQTVTLNSCIKNVNIAFDTTSQPTESYFYKITTSTTPIINSPNNYIKSYSSECNESSDIVMTEYFTNGTKAILKSTGYPYGYFCSSPQNEPYEYGCSIWGCGSKNTSTNCQQVKPYYYSVFCN